MKKNFKPIVLTVLGYGSLGGALFLGDQVRRIYAKIEKATNSDVMHADKIQPNYIYIEDPFLQDSFDPCLTPKKQFDWSDAWDAVTEPFDQSATKKIQAGFAVGKERLKLTRLHKWLRNKIEESFMFRSWYYYRKNLPWKLLRMAQDENYSHRLRAVESLASMNNLTDADYQQLAQACDLRTAVGLARSTKNVKFLLDPPNYKQKPDRDSINKMLHDLFIKLEENSKHSCLGYFVSKFIVDLTDIGMKDNTVFEDEFRINFDNPDFIPLCLEALLHHSWTNENAKQIITYGGLRILMEIYKLLEKDNFKSRRDLIVLSKLLSNISVCPDSAKSFFVSGWIKMLGILSHNKDIRISAPAQKALLNFDEDDPAHEGSIFYRRLFPLHPIRRTSVKPKVDVIFIHGLLGEIFITWRQRKFGHCKHKSPLELLGLTASDEEERAASFQTTKPLDQDFILDVRDLDNWEKMADSYEFVLSDIPIDANCDCNGPFYGTRKQIEHKTKFTKCWPKDWLAEDCPEIRLIGVNYETNISKWTSTCPISPMRSLHERSRLLVDILVRAGVGRRPIIWIGHSMGGLLVKGVLTLARESENPKIHSLLDQTKGVFFYSTPHKGSHLAKLNPTSQMIVWPSVEVQELREKAPPLLELHRKFLKLVQAYPIKVFSFAERESTYITSLKFELRFVDSSSADPDIGESFGIPLDHLSICKPAGKQSFLYQKVKQFVEEVLREVKS